MSFRLISGSPIEIAVLIGLEFLIEKYSFCSSSSNSSSVELPDISYSKISTISSLKESDFFTI